MLGSIVIILTVGFVVGITSAVRWVLARIPDSYSFWHEFRAEKMSQPADVSSVVWPRL